MTTILNKLCGTNFETKEDHFSRTTNDVQFGSTSDGNIIVDLPGIYSGEKIKEFLKIQISTLSAITLKLICFIIKNEFRYDYIIKNAFIMSKIFSEHKNNICIIITFSEDLNNIKKSEIKNILNIKLKIPNDNIIFSSNKVSKDEILNNINKVKNKVQNINSIKFSLKYLLRTVGCEICDFSMIEIREKYEKEYRDALRKFKKEFDNSKDNSLKMQLSFGIRNYTDNLIDKFTDICKAKITDYDAVILEIITFYNFLNEILERSGNFNIGEYGTEKILKLII